VPYFDGAAARAVRPAVLSGTTATAGPMRADPMQTLAGGQGTLLAVVPAEDGRSHLAIVGYLLPDPSPAVRLMPSRPR
jgi:hypothetical protein